VHVGNAYLRGFFYAQPHSRVDMAAAVEELHEMDEDKMLLDSAVKATDGFFTTFFVSPYSRYIARFAARMGWTPNAMTTVSMLIGIAAAVAAGGASIARAGGPPAHGEFVLTETTTARASVDVDRSGSSSPGDAFIFHSVLTNGSGTTVGSVNGHCVVLLGGRNLCHSVVELAHGTLSTTFVATAGSAALHISIDGGTGRLDRAHGQITATRATATAFREVFDIDR
jgi:hypothetical protein